jgi:hypothetical protein
VTNLGKPNQVETILPQCDANASVKPCWRINVDTMNCTGTTHHFTLKIERSQAPAPETHVIANCVTEATDN